jgi:hypothetical protein
MGTKNSSVIYLAEGRKWIYICEVYELIAMVLASELTNDSSGIRYAVIEAEHKKLIEKVVMKGDLIPRNQLTKEDESFAIGAQLRGSVISVDELRDYVSRFEIDVEVNELAIKEGRYTLEDAARVMAEGCDEEEKNLIEKIIQAVANNSLKIYKPGSKVVYELTRNVWPHYDEAYWDELNEWIKKELPGVSWRFPRPNKKIILGSDEGNKAEAIWSFEDLKSREVTIEIINSGKVSVIARGKRKDVTPDDLGLSPPKRGGESLGWKILNGAVYSSGVIDSRQLNYLHKTHDVEKNKASNRRRIGRLKNALKKSLNLVDNPISNYQKEDGCWKFKFKALRDKALN